MENKEISKVVMTAYGLDNGEVLLTLSADDTCPKIVADLVYRLIEHIEECCDGEEEKQAFYRQLAKNFLTNPETKKAVVDIMTMLWN